MSHYFAFPLPSDLQAKIDDTLARHAKGEYVDSKVSTDMAIGTTDGVIKQLALDVIDILKSGGEGAGLLGVLANLLQSTMHMLIRQIMGKVSHGEQDRLAGYLSRRRIALTDGVRFGFSLSDTMGERFQTLLARIDGGDLGSARADLTRAMTDFVSVAVENFYDDFTGCIEMGFVKKKMVDVGRGTIVKASNSTVAKLFASMNDDDLKRVAAHYATMFIKA